MLQLAEVEVATAAEVDMTEVQDRSAREQKRQEVVEAVSRWEVEAAEESELIE